MLPCFSWDRINMAIYWITIGSKDKSEGDFSSFCEASSMEEAVDYFYNYLKFVHFDKEEIEHNIKKEIRNGKKESKD